MDAPYLSFTGIGQMAWWAARWQTHDSSCEARFAASARDGSTVRISTVRISTVRISTVRISTVRISTVIAVLGCGVVLGCSAAPESAAVKSAPRPELDASEISDLAAPEPDPVGVATSTVGMAVEASPRAHESPPSPRESEPAVDARPRVYAAQGLVRIYEKPDRDASVIGAFRAGQAVLLKEEPRSPLLQQRRVYRCTDGWYPVEPRGFVCVGGPGHGTLDADAPGYWAAKAVLPDTNSDYPFRYGTSVGAPQYLRIPTKAEQRQVEPGLDAHLAALPAPDESGAIDLTMAGKGPSAALRRYLDHEKPALTHEQVAYKGYKIAWVSEIDAEGRTWLLTPDMTLVPKDKVRQKPLPTFRGIDLKDRTDLKLPLGFFWLGDAKKFRKGADGKLHPTDEVFKRHEFVEATMDQAKGPGGLIYWRMRDDSYVAYSDVSIIRAVDERPPGVGSSDKWVEVRVTWGYLVAYEGSTPVYATAMSPGVDGIASKGHATARGKHYVDWKLLSGDMSGRDRGSDWFVDEVPWVQYYKGNYAVHGAWWHNDFGRPKSHGCVNLAPADARRMFAWMDPQIPEDWYAVSTYYPHVRGTMLLIRH
jgi:hypothetical protein